MVTPTGVGKGITPLCLDKNDQTANLYRQIAYARATIPELTLDTLQKLASRLSVLGFTVIEGDVTDNSLFENLAEIQSLAIVRLPVIDIASRVVLMKETGIDSGGEHQQCRGMIEQLLSIEQDYEWGDFRDQLTSELIKLSEKYTKDVAKEPSQTQVEKDIQEAVAEVPVTPPAQAEEERLNGQKQLMKNADRLYSLKKYNSVLSVLEDADAAFPDALWVRGRTYTKLKRFEEALEAFKQALDAPDLSNSQKHLYLCCRAKMWLEYWKHTKKDDYIEGCTANLLASLRHGLSKYMASIALEVSSIERLSKWPNSYMHLLSADCAIHFFNEGQSQGAFDILCKYPPPKYQKAASIAGSSKEGNVWDVVSKLCKKPMTKDQEVASIAESLKTGNVLGAVSQLCEGPIATRLRAALLGEALKKNLSFAQDIKPKLCMRAYKGGLLLLGKGGLNLSKMLLFTAWNLQRRIKSQEERWIEVNIRYGAVLARLGDFDALKLPISLLNQGGPLYYLMQGFYLHHCIGKSALGSDIVDLSLVKNLLAKGKEHFQIAGQDPYWKRVIQYYFPEKA